MPQPPVPDEPSPLERVAADKERREKAHRDMMRSVITEPLSSDLRKSTDPAERFDVIISLNELYKGGLKAALEVVKAQAAKWDVRYDNVSDYVFACLSKEQILALADDANERILQGPHASVIYRIWEDSDTSLTLTRSLVTIKADAAQRAFQAQGKGIVWAVMDSGIQADHSHFHSEDTDFGVIDTTAIPDPLVHRDFTPEGRSARDTNDNPLIGDPTATTDRFGHGTHVAGIIAGAWKAKDQKQGDLVVGTEMRDERAPDLTPDQGIPKLERLRNISGVAPQCRLVSLKVIADRTRNDDVKQQAGRGKVSWVLLAIEQIQQWNQHGKRLLVHGVNMSLGYEFNPRWFACGQSPLCVEVNRLVQAGVVVVVSAGNNGYSAMLMASGRELAQYNPQSITDPGNADLAITVGSTHREMPHLYGVSYFSSRGPTGDGRMKPDLIAPGERIVSCAAGLEKGKYEGLSADNAAPAEVLYCEQTGTSMAAPHVSGAVAAFLSVRSEFIGNPRAIKEILLANTIDLGRDRNLQGAGLMDLMRVLQAV